PFEEKVIQGDYAKGGFPDSLDLVDSKLLVTYKNGKYGLINGKGKYIAPLGYDRISNFIDGIALFQKGIDSLSRPLYGFMNTEGKTVIPAKYTFNPKRKEISYTNAYTYKDKMLLLKPSDTTCH